MAALVELPAGTAQSCGKNYTVFGDAFCTIAWDVDAMTSVVVRGGSEVPSIYTVGGPGAAVVGYLVYYDSRAWRC